MKEVKEERKGREEIVWENSSLPLGHGLLFFKFFFTENLEFLIFLTRNDKT